MIGSETEQADSIPYPLDIIYTFRDRRSNEDEGLGGVIDHEWYECRHLQLVLQGQHLGEVEYRFFRVVVPIPSVFIVGCVVVVVTCIRLYSGRSVGYEVTRWLLRTLW